MQNECSFITFFAVYFCFFSFWQLTPKAFYRQRQQKTAAEVTGKKGAIEIKVFLQQYSIAWKWDTVCVYKLQSPFPLYFGILFLPSHYCVSFTADKHANKCDIFLVDYTVIVVVVLKNTFFFFSCWQNTAEVTFIFIAFHFLAPTFK